ncbi:enoyl-CoA hydratase/isomerase family protein [Thermodesulfobacteriota bacterium]
MEYIKYDKRDNIAIITIDRAERLNALNLSAMREIGECWKRFRDDGSAWVAILTSAGDRAFCVGADLKDDSRTGEEDEREIFKMELELSPRQLGVNKPIICAIKGHCLGFGWWLAMECDMRIASTDAKLGIPEARVGICPFFGGLVSDHLPPGIAMELILTGKPLDADRAYALGFVNRVVEKDRVDDEARRLAESILDNAPVSVRRAKDLYYRTLPINRAPSLDRAYIIAEQLSQMEDKKEAVSAFKEKRKPQWKER